MMVFMFTIFIMHIGNMCASIEGLTWLYGALASCQGFLGL